LIELGSRSWFGGGADLTPYYPHEEDFLAFHRHWSEACSPYGNYPEMKSKCDQYFVNVHRGGEMRGVGGIFFDRFRTENIHKDLKMALELSAAFPGSYLPIVSRRKDETATLEDEEFQLMRRGRYAEFNLLHDRGTAFGLRTGGRVESILVSMPPRCTFPYKYKACTGSAQEKMLKYYWPRDWDL
jgi:coproporphyrinogen III oxidase